MTPERRKRAQAWIGRYLKSNEDEVSDAIMWERHHDDETEEDVRAEQELQADVKALAEEFAGAE